MAMDLAEIEVFGSKRLAQAGGAVYRALQRLQDEGATIGAMAEAEEAEERYRRVMQRDLGLRKTSLSEHELDDVETQAYHPG